MVLKKLENYTIILASSSPRRQQFLKDLGLSFEVRLKEIDEVYPQNLKGSEITDFLADLKSQPFDNELSESDLLITSDTIVWLENEALGKPSDFDEAFSMLKRLSNNTHKVITSVSIKNKNFQHIFNDTTLVKFRAISTDEINYYINTFKPFDKAGAYGIQEWIGKVAIERIEGSYFNVMGLPVNKLYAELINL